MQVRQCTSFQGAVSDSGADFANVRDAYAQSSAATASHLLANRGRRTLNLAIELDCSQSHLVMAGGTKLIFPFRNTRHV